MPTMTYMNEDVQLRVTPASPAKDTYHGLNDGYLPALQSGGEAEEPQEGMELLRNSSHSSHSSDDDQSECSMDDRPLFKKSSLRRRGSPPPNKSVSWNQSVMRQTEYRLTVEPLKPAAEPVYHQWYPSYSDYEYVPQYYQQRQYYYHHSDYYHRSYSQNRSYQARGGNSRRNRRTNRDRRNYPSHNPSAMLSAWIDRDH